MSHILLCICVLSSDLSPSKEIVLKWDGRCISVLTFEQIEAVCDNALKELDRLGNTQSEDVRVPWLMRRGQARRCMQRHMDAFRDFSACRIAGPENAHVAFEYARCALTIEERHAEVMPIAAELVASRSTAALGQYLLGAIAQHATEWDRAVNAYTEALRDEPHWASALECRAYCFYKLGCSESCLSDLDSALKWPEATPNSAANLALLRASALTHLNRYDQAHAVLATAFLGNDRIRDKDRKLDIEAGLWTLNAWREDPLACAQLADWRIAEAPEDPFGYEHAALAYAALGDLGKARKFADKALALATDKRTAWGTLARVLYQQGEFDNCVRCFGRALEKKSAASHAFYEDALWLAFVLATCPDDNVRDGETASHFLDLVASKWSSANMDPQFMQLRAMCLAESGMAEDAVTLMRRAGNTPPLPGEPRQHFQLLEEVFARGKPYRHDPRSRSEQLVSISPISFIGVSGIALDERRDPRATER